MSERLQVAVLVGGLSAEHDVSVVTGLQVLEALDPQKYAGFPVYIGLDGQWWVGDALRDKKNYLPDLAVKRQLTRVSLNVGDANQAGQAVLREVGAPMWRAAKVFPIDVAMPALHGTWGEDGTLQGVLSSCGVAFTGGGVGAMATAMNKAQTMVEAVMCEIPVPESLLIKRGEEVDVEKITEILGKFPLFVKPNFLGSSIGARQVKNEEELEEAVAAVFRLDTAALVQTCVANLVEYNVAVRRNRDGKVVTSAIERPLRKGELLDFKDKYGEGMDEAGNKLGGTAQGMVDASRELNPKELGGRGAQVRAWATALFIALDMRGAPRLDFLCNSKTEEIWFNEINPVPGSLASFLWEAASPRINFSDLLDEMIEEARAQQREVRLVDPLGSGGVIFRKRG